MIKSLFSAILLFCALNVSAQLQYKGAITETHVAQSVVSTSGDYMFVTHDHKLSAYKVDQKTGKLKEIQEISHSTGGEFGSLTVSDDDRFLYTSIGMNSSVVR
jgi:6-phosphogluconolactonase (cycloisomerase 2 family)